MSPTERSLAYLRRQGYAAEVVERFVRRPGGGFRKDLFGFVDIVAVQGNETLGVQVTTSDHVSDRAAKARLALESQPALRACSWRFIVHGWRGRVLREVEL